MYTCDQSLQNRNNTLIAMANSISSFSSILQLILYYTIRSIFQYVNNIISYSNVTYTLETELERLVEYYKDKSTFIQLP